LANSPERPLPERARDPVSEHVGESQHVGESGRGARPHVPARETPEVSEPVPETAAGPAADAFESGRHLLEPPTAHDIPARAAVLDRARLEAELTQIAGPPIPPEEARNTPQGTADPKTRAKVLQTLKTHLQAGRTEIHRRFYQEHATGRAVMQATCYLADELIGAILGHVTQRLHPLANPSAGEKVCLAAVGGYGRGELAPHSDIDLLFLLPWKMTPHTEQVVEEVLYFLWDLGFKVGHATRSVDDCLRMAKNDVTVRTNLLESRLLWGDGSLFDALTRRYAEEIQAKTAAEFIEAKLAERDERHKRLGDSRYHLEPNIKEGKGGLRDLSTVFWITKYVYQVSNAAQLVDRNVFTRAEAKRFDKAQAFLWTLRCHLHFQTRRPEERLTFDLQKDIAPLMGYHDHAGQAAVERFMKHYYLVAKDVGDLTRIVCAQLEAEHKRSRLLRLPGLGRNKTLEGFKVEGERLSVAEPGSFQRKPIRILKIFEVAQRRGLDIHPRALRWITQNLKFVDRKLREDAEANRLFLQMLTSQHDPETTLRRLNEAGVLGRFLPDFGRIVAQMQYNMYHHYTVDEHTIFAIGELAKVERGDLAEAAPIASEVVHKVLSRRALYVAVLLHDIAKGRPEDHSEKGAEIARKLCPRLGLTDEESETVQWLVLHHLDMPKVAFRRDLEEPRTIRDFAATVQSVERLRLLLCLTVVDIRSVGPGVWNSWKAALLRDLYWNTKDELTGGFNAEARDRRVAKAKDELTQRLSDWTEGEVETHLERGYPSYWLSCDPDTHERHARMVRSAEREARALTVDTRIDDYRGVTEITVYTADHPGLFSRISGALAVAGASITAARIFTLKNGMALDTFWVRDQQGGRFDRGDKLARVASVIERTLAGRLHPMQELEKQRSNLPSRYDSFRVAPRVLIDNTISAKHTVIEVNGRDRPGLLYELTQVLTKADLMIHAAKISTYGERVVDVFYVQTALRDKVESEQKLRRLRQKLGEVLEAQTGAGKAGGGQTGGQKAASKAGV
jgi:[protein-PII] uridylyltransferase